MKMKVGDGQQLFNRSRIYVESKSLGEYFFCDNRHDKQYLQRYKSLLTVFSLNTKDI